LFAFAVTAATIATLTLHILMGVEDAQPYVLITDLGLLAFTGVIALRAESYWPMWFTGFHSIAVATGLARFTFPVSVPQIYIDAAGFWALPALGFATIGVLLDRKAKLAGLFSE
jgi:hypothetical protein